MAVLAGSADPPKSRRDSSDTPLGTEGKLLWDMEVEAFQHWRAKVSRGNREFAASFGYSPDPVILPVVLPMAEDGDEDEAEGFGRKRK